MTLGQIAKRLAALLALLPALAAQAGTVTYHHNDLAGSPVVATNEAGQVIWRESYRPYGERTVKSAASSGNKVWFTSRPQDADTGLVYMGARYYDPLTGRFVSTDPVGFDEQNLHSFNRYAYANNNPYKYVDPDGRTAVDVGFALWDGGRLLGAMAAFAVGAATGDQTLQAVAIEGIRETRTDAGLSLGAIFLPVSSGALKGVAKLADDALDASMLSKRLASEAQMSEAGIAIAGAGTSKAFRDAERVAAEHGGSAADWAKKTSSAYKSSDGTTIQTRWVENVTSGTRVEYKTIITGP